MHEFRLLPKLRSCILCKCCICAAVGACDGNVEPCALPAAEVLAACDGWWWWWVGVPAPLLPTCCGNDCRRRRSAGLRLYVIFACESSSLKTCMYVCTLNKCLEMKNLLWVELGILNFQFSPVWCFHFLPQTLRRNHSPSLEWPPILWWRTQPKGGEVERWRKEVKNFS